MEDVKEIERFKNRLFPKIEEVLEIAYFTGKAEGENETEKEFIAELTKHCSKVYYSNNLNGEELTLWLVVPNEFLKVFPWIKHNFTADTLDLISMQIGTKTFSDAIEENKDDPYTVEDYKIQQRIIVDFFRYADVEEEPGYLPMDEKDYDYVWRKLMINKNN